ncbi:oligosaccharide flippase family protein, partial [bacterium]|nr:oligosaccharide flippase family protein [bacterium]
MSARLPIGETAPRPRAHRSTAPEPPAPDAPATGDAMPRRFVTGVAWVGIAIGLQAVFRVVLISVLTKYLGPARYGLWSVFLATVEILVPLAVLGMRYGYSRSRAGMGESRESAAAFYASGIVVVGFSLLLSGLWWLSAQWFADTFMNSNPEGARMVQVGGLILAFGTAELMLREYLGTFLLMRARGLVVVARFSLDVAAALLVWTMDWGPVALVGCMMASRLLPTLGGVLLIVRRFGMVRPDWSVVKPYMRFGLPLQIAGVSSLLLRLGDRQVLGALRSEADTGIFSASSDLGLLILMMVYTLQPVLFPALASLFNRGKTDRAVWLFERTLTYYLFVAIPTVAFLCVASGSVLTLFTTAAFA